jgi:two-component system, NtrC family, sensor histidine kinase HydH
VRGLPRVDTERTMSEKRKRINEYIPMVTMVVVFLLLTGLSLLFLQSQREKEKILLEQEIEKTAVSIVEALRNYMRGAREVSLVLEDDILGFGLYQENGKPLLTYGDAPKDISREDIQSPRFDWVRDKNTLRLLGPLGRGPEFNPFPKQGGRMIHRLPAEMNQIVFLEMRIGNYLTRQRLYQVGLFLVPLAFGGAALYAGHLLRKNRNYREHIYSQERLVQLGEAARTLAHEIKNPLSAIRLRTGVLKKIGDEKVLEDVRIIEEETDRLSRLVDRVREFLKSPLGEPEVIDLRSFLEELTSRFPPSLEWKDETKTETSKPLVRVDPLRFRSVVENILTNAFESYPEEVPAEERRVALSLKRDRREKNRYSIVVQDEGRGIPKEESERIFDLFYTTKNEGSGIGLSISKRFVEAVGGELVLKENPGGGTQVVLHLPGENEEGISTS